MSKNEQITVNIVRKKLEAVGIMEENGFLVDEQVIQNVLIKKLLPSKTETGSGKGRPEFLISRIGDKDFLIVIECKADIKFHESLNQNQPANFAVDGVLLYASKLSQEYNVIAIAASGQTKEELKINTFLFPKNSGTHSTLTDTKKVPVTDVISWKDYIRLATYDESLASSRKRDLSRFSRDLHNYLRDYAKITVAQMPLLISGILIALMEKGFKVAYQKYTGSELAQKTFQAIKDQINKTTLGVNQDEKKRAIMSAFNFIEYHPELQKIDKKKNESPLGHIVREIDSEMKPFTQDRFDFDVIGNFYGEFIRYTGGDAQGLGIVLTPKHITELFVDLAKLDKNDKVLDTCCGTGGFLISAMKKMTEGVSEEERKKILEKSLIGVEQEPSMFALAVSNMILWGDGKTNLYQGSCFDEDIFKQIKNQASVGFINPPYSQQGENLHEWNFVITLLDALQKNATGIVIVPMGLAIAPHSLREQLLKEHRLEAVMSMPNDLFYPVGVVACIMVFTAHVPHNSDSHHESWFGYWKNDGFRKDRIEGRIDIGQWQTIREKWLVGFTNKKAIPGFSVRKKVSTNDEWCAEAYLETDYKNITNEEFMKVFLDYIAYNVRENRLSFVKELLVKNNKKVSLFDRKWGWFEYKDLFNVKIGKSIDLNKLEQSEGGINYVSRTEENNGVTARVTNSGSFVVCEGGCITVPMVGNELKSSYQTESFCVSQNIAILRPKDFSLNVYNANFLNTIIRKDIFRFAYGRTLSLDRLKMLKIKLPTDKNGNPDWEFMEDYIKSLPYSASI